MYVELNPRLLQPLNILVPIKLTLVISNVFKLVQSSKALKAIFLSSVNKFDLVFALLAINVVSLLAAATSIYVSTNTRE